MGCDDVVDGDAASVGRGGFIVIDPVKKRLAALLADLREGSTAMLASAVGHCIDSLLSPENITTVTEWGACYLAPVASWIRSSPQLLLLLN